MVQIIPAILATTEEDFKRSVSSYKRSSLFQEGWVHIDFADNIFVQNQTISPSVVARYPMVFHKEAHIMVADPLDWVDELVEAGFERVIFHIEIAEDVAKYIEYIKGKGLQVGLAIKNETSIERLEPYADKIDVVLLMSIIPGLQGQPFIEGVIDKIKEVSNLRSRCDYSLKIGVDGSVKNTNIKQLVDAGVDFVIVGSYLLKGDIDENLENLWEAIQR